MRNHLKVVGIAALLAGCSGGDGGGSSLSPLLSNKADVAREIVSMDLARFAPDSGSASSKSGRELGPDWSRGRARAKSAGPGGSPMAGPRETGEAFCDSGSYTYSYDYGEQTLVMFSNVTTEMDYGYEDYDQCAYDGGTFDEAFDGYFEFGDNYAYAAGTATDPNYQYYDYRDGSAPFTYAYSEAGSDELVTRDLRYEFAFANTAWEFRYLGSVEYSRDVGVTTYSQHVTFGSGSSPFRRSGDDSTGTFETHGAYAYSTSECEGGEFEYTTLDPLTFGADFDGPFVNGGELEIASGKGSVTVTFSLDGDASFQIKGGPSGVITREELATTASCFQDE